MTDPAPLTPRPLAEGDRPAPGDVYFEHGDAPFSRIIQLGTLSDVNHVGVVIDDLGDGWWLVAEAVARGFVIHARPAPNAYVARLGDPGVRDAVVAESTRMAKLGLGYDWWSITRLAIRILGRLPGLRLPVRALLRRMPMPDNPRRVICSDAVRQVVEAAAGTVLPFGKPSYLTTPQDLRRWAFHLTRWDGR